MIDGKSSPVVSTLWLEAHLASPGLRVVDATWYMPHAERDARREFHDAHVPDAVFFDIDDIADHDSPLPHMLPSAERFAAKVGGLRIGSGDHVVVYGARNMIASARAWWMFRAFGHESVSVLDGGFPRWKAERRPVESGARSPRRAALRPSPRGALVADLDRVNANLETGEYQVVDARSVGRFVGSEAEPRPGLRSGHIPGSHNLPYDRLFHDDGSLLRPPQLRQAFAQAGVDPGKPVIASCGSGVSACVLALALYLLGQKDAAVYDGSWAEWGGRAAIPIAS